MLSYDFLQNYRNGLAAERDCRKNPCSKNVQKNLPQQAKKLPKSCQNVVRNTKKPDVFQRFCPTFSTVSTACISPKWASRESAGERKKLKARKRLEKRAESHLSAACCLLCWHAFVVQDSAANK